jgi:hypothetical protein
MLPVTTITRTVMLAEVRPHLGARHPRYPQIEQYDVRLASPFTA